MVTGTDIRLVPMSREMRLAVDEATLRGTFGDEPIQQLINAYDNAPADPREVIANAIRTSWGEYWKTGDSLEDAAVRSSQKQADFVLCALGWTKETT